MIPYKTFAVLGGDLRQAHIANRLATQGKTVYALLLEKNCAVAPGLSYEENLAEILPACDVVVFPLPMSTDERTVNAPFSEKKLKLSECFSKLRPDTVVLGGKVSRQIHELAKNYQVTVIDYLEREELAVKNAVITAEGALGIALEELPISMFGSRCLITGHGRVAKALMRVLSGMGAEVLVAARKCGDLAEIEAAGCRAVHIAMLAEHVTEVDVVFNTVPACLFTRQVLSRLDHDTLVIDLASRPGGVAQQKRFYAPPPKKRPRKTTFCGGAWS